MLVSVPSKRKQKRRNTAGAAVRFSLQDTIILDNEVDDDDSDEDDELYGFVDTIKARHQLQEGRGGNKEKSTKSSDALEDRRLQDLYGISSSSSPSITSTLEFAALTSASSSPRRSSSSSSYQPLCPTVMEEEGESSSLDDTTDSDCDDDFASTSSSDGEMNSSSCSAQSPKSSQKPKAEATAVVEDNHEDDIDVGVLLSELSFTSLVL